jgi:hypothetical protein
MQPGAYSKRQVFFEYSQVSMYRQYMHDIMYRPVILKGAHHERHE